MVLVMGHLSGLLILQKRPQRAHKIPLEVNQKVSPSAWYNGIPGWAKSAVPVKIQLKDFNNYPNCKQYSLIQEAKEVLQQIIKRFLKHGLLRPCQSPCNTPILPIIQPAGEYRVGKGFMTGK
jgi:hypothetical protein